MYFSDGLRESLEIVLYTLQEETAYTRLGPTRFSGYVLDSYNEVFAKEGLIDEGKRGLIDSSIDL